uniref:Green fluorescent protein n=1 Tax=Renilla reniformis TaxID=6136 RepID=Q963I9_RENRE|nr:green fluorescent protein [Renilla reniformis]
MDLAKLGLKEVMPTKINLEGLVGDHAFSMEGVGEGNILEGTQEVKISVTKGAPLPFAFDIVSVAFSYGNRAYTGYPEEISDYFLQSFPEGFTYERNIRYQDGGTAIVKSDISLEDGKFIVNVDFKAKDLRRMGPVMQQDIVGMQPSYESMYTNVTSVIGECIIAFKLQTGKHFTYHMRTVYKSKKPVETMPLYHFIQHRLVKTNVDTASGYVVQHETAIAAHSTIKKIEGSLP